ncbi:MAG TPA: HAMP domain-containing sensor histidine kinase [Ideonella sp.]|uniref:sensor histidine kinase n=1 Tax=Ideonella sp. TaxID=1929293 RepID=UPI002E317992|nr:HAMP domain-containing sensor histidine kinase [Ideonella sp.]HEX5682912.1 HAMP domain-containing sensor histidine kinase [Ideonella sp.]
MQWTNRLPDVQALLPTRIPLRLRVFFRGVFVLLALATVALAGFVLREEKELGLRAYREGFAKTKEQIVSRLRHPTGQLALLNPDARGTAVTPLHPVVLPFSAIDFDDKAKVQQAVEMAGCGVQYGDGATLCVAIGSNPLAGGFIYAVGGFATGELVPKPPGVRDLNAAHRVRVEVAMRGQTWRWLAPYEMEPPNLPRRGRPPEGAKEARERPVASFGGPDTTGAQRGRLTGFAEEADGTLALKPVRDFRGWLWQDARCVDGQTGDDCPRRAFYSVRLPIELFRDELQTKRSQIVWPPADLNRILIHLQVLAPSGATLFDSNQPDATPPFGLADLQPILLPGETLRLAKAGAQGDTELALLQGNEVSGVAEPSWWDRFTAQLIRRLEVEGYEQPLVAQDTIATPLGRYELTLTGDVRSVNRTLGRVAARVGWIVVAMLAAIVLAWVAIELRIVRRITLLTKRAAAVRHGVQSLKGGADDEIRLDVADLRGSDELGLLAGTLAELLERVNDDVRREQIRTAQEREQWHAVGHEIMSPLQSLLALHPGDTDPSHRYLRRMQQAVRVLYGQASPTEAFEATTLAVNALDIDEFLRHVADNAPHAGISDVCYTSAGAPCLVRGDEYSLEDVVTHVLRNAERYRPAGTPIQLTLATVDAGVEVTIHNQGPPIPDELVGRIFEYGVSDAAGEPSADPAHRGQGLFVVRTYMAKMGGTVEARNEPEGGVSFVLRLARA